MEGLIIQKKIYEKFQTRPKESETINPVIKKITSMIQNGELREGEKLPPQDVLAKHLGVSRTTLREALKELSYRGLIICKHGVGTFVTSQFIDSLEVIEARKFVEMGTSYYAGLLTTPNQARKLLKLVDSMEKYIRTLDYEAFSLKDLEFHKLITKLSGNRVFQKIMQTISDIMLPQQVMVQKLPGAIERAHHFHRLIAEAIYQKDPEKASKLMEEHLEDVHQALIKRNQGGGNK